jgi:hypothetical protein
MAARGERPCGGSAPSWLRGLESTFAEQQLPGRGGSAWSTSGRRAALDDHLLRRRRESGQSGSSSAREQAVEAAALGRFGEVEQLLAPIDGEQEGGAGTAPHRIAAALLHHLADSKSSSWYSGSCSSCSCVALTIAVGPDVELLEVDHHVAGADAEEAADAEHGEQAVIVQPGHEIVHLGDRLALGIDHVGADHLARRHGCKGADVGCDLLLVRLRQWAVLAVRLGAPAPAFAAFPDLIPEGDYGGPGSRHSA